jgi:hypothetical protein
LSIIKLEGDNEEALYTLLHYIYYFDYSMPTTPARLGAKRALFHLEMLQVADKYGVKEVSIVARDKF